MPRNEATMNGAFERGMQGKSLPGDEYLLTGIRSYPVPETSMSLEEAMKTLPRFFSLPETIFTAKQ